VGLFFKERTMVALNRAMLVTCFSVFATVSGVENFLAPEQVKRIAVTNGDSDPMDPEELANLAFSIGDTDGSGYLEAAEVEKLREKLTKLSSGFANLDWHQYDSEGNGRLSRDDLHSFIVDPKNYDVMHEATQNIEKLFSQ